MDDARDFAGVPRGWERALRYGAALAVMAFFLATLVHSVARDPGRLPGAVVDVVLGFGCLALLPLRRRRPFAIALVTAALTVVSVIATGPALVAYVSLVSHRRWSAIVPVAVVLWVCTALFGGWQGLTQVTIISLSTMSVSLVALTITGLYLRSRDDLEHAHREQEAAKERSEAERIEQARLGERVRIAREMHDVLAHRISLLSLHAGALAHRTDLTPAEVRAAATVIQENAHQSLNELRATLSTLRDGSPTAPPQPSFGELDALFQEVRDAGQRVEVTDEVIDRERMPAQAGRHVYRIVQEGLTNARRHSPGTRVEVRLHGRPGDALHVRISNLAAPGHPRRSGPGLGLVGLAERMEMVGGSLTHTLDRGRFVLEAAVPWEREVRA